MLQIDINDEDRQALKDRALRAVEQRLVDALFEQTKREVSAEALKSVRASMRDRVVNAVVAYLDEQRLRELLVELFTDGRRRESLVRELREPLAKALSGKLDGVLDQVLGALLSKAGA